jgi:hypothetical protein
MSDAEEHRRRAEEHLRDADRHLRSAQRWNRISLWGVGLRAGPVRHRRAAAAGGGGGGGGGGVHPLDEEVAEMNFTIGETVPNPRPGRPPIHVTAAMYEAVSRLRSATIVAAQRRSTLTYSDAEAAIDSLYPARGLAPVLDLLSHDCIARGEPALAALVVRKDTGQVGDGFMGDAALAREECYARWGGDQR